MKKAEALIIKFLEWNNKVVSKEEILLYLKQLLVYKNSVQNSVQSELLDTIYTKALKAKELIDSKKVDKLDIKIADFKLLKNQLLILAENHKKSTKNIPKNRKIPKGLQQLGFIPANHKFQENDSIETFELPNKVGEWLGKIQPYKLLITVHGETHSLKTQLVYQIANSFAKDKFVSIFDLEQGGLISTHTQDARDRNIEKRNIPNVAITGIAENGLDTIKEAAKYSDVIIIDSWQELKERTTERMNELRSQFPNVIFIVLVQLNDKNTMRGGSSGLFDAPISISTHRPDHTDHSKSYAVFIKNRGNRVDQKYMIANKEIKPIYEVIEPEKPNNKDSKNTEKSKPKTQKKHG